MFCRLPSVLLCKYAAHAPHCFYKALWQRPNRGKAARQGVLSKSYKMRLSRFWFPAHAPKTMKDHLLLAVDRALIPLFFLFHYLRSGDASWYFFENDVTFFDNFFCKQTVIGINHISLDFGFHGY